LVQADSVFEDELVEGLLPQGRVHRRMSHFLGAWPGAVEPGEVTGPEKVSQPDLRRTAKPALFLHLEREEDLTLHELGWLVRKKNVAPKDTRRWTAQSYSRSKRQKMNGTQPTPASSRTKRTPGWRSQMPERTTALKSSVMSPMGKFITVISD